MMEDPENPMVIQEDVELAPDAEVPAEIEESLRREREEDDDGDAA